MFSSGQATIPTLARLREAKCAERLFCFVNARSIPFAKRQMHSRNVNDSSPMPTLPMSRRFQRLLRLAAIVLALGVAFAWFGVYGTSAMPFLERVVYWTGLMALGFASAALIVPWVFERALAAQHPLLRAAVAAALISTPVTAGLIAIQSIDGTLLPVSQWPVQYAYAFAVSAVMTLGAWAATRALGTTAFGMNPPELLPSTPGASAGRSAALLDRLPVRLRTADIYAISAEDHYLRVHTSGGEELILLRLSDAMREMSGIEGLQTHRSWWVARQGLADVSKGDGKLVLKLKSGVEAPVSRTYAPAVRAAGWI